LDYLSIILLDQRINGFDITISKKRTTAIQNLVFLKMLKDLKIYLNFTDWLRQYISYYTQLTEHLQDRKTELFRKGSKTGPARKAYSKKTSIENVSNLEIKAFETIQRSFNKLNFLYY